jgi:N-acetylmuramoyl-L-alanine amidase
MTFSVFRVDAQFIRFTKKRGKRFVYLVDVARYYGMKLVRKKKGCELVSHYSRIMFKYNSRKAVFNGIKLTFSHSPYFNKEKNMPLLSEHDFLLFLDPMLRKSSLSRARIRSVMLDPGHGAKDTGAIGHRYREKDIVLKIALKLRVKLRQMGFRVLMTRTGDSFPSLHDRTELCKKYKPDLFISIHCNSGGSSGKARGVETYCMTPAGESSTADNKPSYKVEEGNKFDKSNARLALEVQRMMLAYTGAKDRGIRRARFFVLKHATCPAILVETGFLSNEFEESLLGAASYQNRIASALAEGVRRYAQAVK